MTKAIGIILCVLLGVLIAVVGFLGARSPSATFEYAIVQPPDEQLEARLNALGRDGWEIVSARRATTENDGYSRGVYEIIVKRRLDTGRSTAPTSSARR